MHEASASNTNRSDTPPRSLFDKKHSSAYLLGMLFIACIIGWNFIKPANTPIWLDVLIQTSIYLGGMAYMIQHFKTSALLESAQINKNWKLIPSSIEILSKQIHTGVSNSETAAMAVIQRMTHIQMINTALHQEAARALSRTSEITNEIQQLSIQSKEALNNFLVQQGQLSELQSKKDENISQAMEDITRLIGPLVDVIRKIAQQTQLLSFNAAIEAARAGPEGSGFKIVATAVRELAKQTTDAAKKIEDGISTVQKAANLNSVSYSKEIANTIQSMQSMHALLEMNMNHSNSLLPFLLELSQNMDQGTAEIKNHVLDILSQMQFQDVLKQILAQVENSLQELSEYCSAKINDSNFQADLDEILKSWQASYVTLEQRLAHNSTIHENEKKSGYQ